MTADALDADATGGCLTRGRLNVNSEGKGYRREIAFFASLKSSIVGAILSAVSYLHIILFSPFPFRDCEVRFGRESVDVACLYA